MNGQGLDVESCEVPAKNGPMDTTVRALEDSGLTGQKERGGVVRVQHQSADILVSLAPAQGSPMDAAVPALEDSGVGGSCIDGGGVGRIEGQGRDSPSEGTLGGPLVDAGANRSCKGQSGENHHQGGGRCRIGQHRFSFTESHQPDTIRTVYQVIFQKRPQP